MQSVSHCLYFLWQPNPSNKLAIIHILGLLSNLFTTLDISHHDDDHESTEVKKLPVQQGPNPVSTARLFAKSYAPLLVAGGRRVSKGSEWRMQCVS